MYIVQYNSQLRLLYRCWFRKLFWQSSVFASEGTGTLLFSTGFLPPPLSHNCARSLSETWEDRAVFCLLYTLTSVPVALAKRGRIERYFARSILSQVCP